MAIAINKTTGQIVTSIGYKQEPYFSSTKWIVNPTNQQIEQYKYIPPEQTESDLAKQFLSESDIKDMPRIAEDIFDFVVNGVEIPQVTIDKINERKLKRSKI